MSIKDRITNAKKAKQEILQEKDFSEFNISILKLLDLIKTVESPEKLGLIVKEIAKFLENFATENIVTMNLFTYILIIFCSKIPMFIVFDLIIILLGLVTNNIPITILISLGSYVISKLEIFINSVKNIYYWDLSKYLFGEITGNLAMAIFISIIIIAVLTSAITIIFKRKDIVNA